MTMNTRKWRGRPFRITAPLTTDALYIILSVITADLNLKTSHIRETGKHALVERIQKLWNLGPGLSVPWNSKIIVYRGALSPSQYSIRRPGECNGITPEKPLRIRG